VTSSARGKRLQQRGTISPADQEKLVRGRLVENVIEGKDAGSMSAKILGSERTVNMWTPENQTGVVILAAPPLGHRKQRSFAESAGRIESSIRSN
jgi:hypothetical protein